MPHPRTRSRSPAKKQAKYEEILEVGTKLFHRQDRQPFTMQDLANELNMVKGNLYNYVKSKRELWIAIQQMGTKLLHEKITQVRKSHQGTNVEMIIKICQKFFEFVHENPRLYRIMYFIPPPKSRIEGPLELNYVPDNILIEVIQILKEAISAKEIPPADSNMLCLHLFSFLLGSVLIESFMQVTNVIQEPVRLSVNIDNEADIEASALEKVYSILGIDPTRK